MYKDESCSRACNAFQPVQAELIVKENPAEIIFLR